MSEKDWLASLLGPQDIAALDNPLILNKEGAVSTGPVGPNDKVFLDPSLFITDGRGEMPALAHRPNPLTAEQVMQAARFTAALLKLNQALTGHESLAIHTFLEVLIASTGMFAFYRGRFVGLYKQQPYIGRGGSRWRVGRPGRFILPHLRQLVRDVTVAQFEKEIGLKVPIERLNPYGPDHLIEKPDYDTTWRNRNYGFVYSYNLYLTDEDWAEVIAERDGKPVLVLEGDDPHPSDDELKACHHVIRMLEPDDMDRLESEERLTLEAEKPRLLDMFRQGQNVSPHERLAHLLGGKLTEAELASLVDLVGNRT